MKKRIIKNLNYDVPKGFVQIPDYNGFSLKGYYINEQGKIWSAKRGIFIRQQKIKPRNTSYYCALLSVYSYEAGKTRLKFFGIHRLLANTFIPNPNNYPTVDHIDGNGCHNTLNNLEWRPQGIARSKSIAKNKLYIGYDTKTGKQRYLWTDIKELYDLFQGDSLRRNQAIARIKNSIKLRKHPKILAPKTALGCVWFDHVPEEKEKEEVFKLVKTKKKEWKNHIL